MNRLLFIAAFAVLFLASVSLSAQRGGGGHAGGGGAHAGFSGHSGFSGGGFGGHVSAGHSFSGARSSGFAGRPLNRGSAFGRGSFGRFNSNHSGIGVRIRSYPYYGRNCWGGYCGYGLGGWGYPYLGGGIDPYWWWNNDSDSGADQAAPYGYDDGLANEMQEQGLPIRPTPNSGDQDFHSRSTPPSAPPQQESTPTAPATVLVFRDQHQEEVQNYAIVGQTLWNFTPQHTQKIPLSDLDIPATQQANDDRGVDFHLPSANEGQ
jgi:hypothetical protein